ncbi:hypothetical protein BDV25DRAFT_122143 [Aspergillus avenaceus]|uniref:Secreted protein n=1 Tax=Aspergillus avenaceus TaxID=36643 RepID=A0A5N6TTW0_ASPAV|nr:hypothetical protein BDV25DRAFT_122143 [Aspergillus avenaceus]
MVYLRHWLAGGALLLPLVVAVDPRLCQTGNEKLPESQFTLKEVEDSFLPELSEIFVQTNSNVSVADVLDSANRALVQKSPPLGNGHPVESWAWNSGDEATSKWYPQGVTSSGDALAAGKWDGREAWIVTWYQKTGGKNVRLSFVDRDTHQYRHVLLVEPSAPDDFKPVGIHAGGIMWYGSALYVVDTHGGLRVFDLNHIWKVADGDQVGKKSGGGYSAANYRYVIPQIRKYDWKALQPDSTFSFSWVSLDRSDSPDTLLVGEYTKDDTNTPIRLVKYALDYQTRKLRTTNGVATATFAHCVDILRMQGGYSLGNKFYLGRSNGESKGSDLFVWSPGSSATARSQWLMAGSEDFSFNPSRGEWYTITEHPGKRYIVAYKKL